MTHHTHPDPAVRELIAAAKADAWDEGWEAAWSPMSMHSLNDGPNPYRAPLTADERIAELRRKLTGTTP